MVNVRQTKKRPISDVYVPSESDGSGDEEDYEEEYEEEGEEEEEAETSTPTPPPPPKVKKLKTAAPPRKRAKIAAAEEEEEDEVEEEEEEGGGEEEDVPVAMKPKKIAVIKRKRAAAATFVAVVGKKNKKVDPVLIKRKPNSSDFEVTLDNNAKVTDMSLVGPKYPRNKILLDERHWIRFGTVAYKSKGINYDQVFIGRDPAKGDVGKDGQPPKPFQMGIPVRCLEPLRRACNFLTGQPELEEEKPKV